MIQLDPTTFLYPLIQKWPTVTKSGETILVCKDGDYVTYLNELRFNKNSAFKLRYKISENRFLPASLAFSGKIGIVETLDYRGKPVVAAIYPVHGTPWFSVVKIDRDEVYRLLRKTIWTIWSFVLILISMAALGIGYRDKLRDKSWLERQFGLNLEKQQYAERLANFTKFANDMIFTLDEADKLIFVNCNLPANTILNIDHEPLLGKEIFEMIPALANDKLIEIYRRIALTGGVDTTSGF